MATPPPSLTQGTKVEAPGNNHSVAEDVRLGRDAAAKVERQFPSLPERGYVDDYVERVGRRLLRALPREFRHRQFRYRFDVVNASDVNAFALPGVPP